MKLKYFDGLRFIFCIIVVIHHFTLAFFPNLNYFLINDGNLAVMYFLILSGIVMPLKKFSNTKEDKNIIKDSLKYLKKRYTRMLLFVSLSIFISFIILKSGLYFNLELADIFDLKKIKEYFNVDVSISQMLYQAFFGSFISRPNLNTPLWTIHYEFIGLFISYIVVSLIYKKQNRYVYYLLLLIFCFVFTRDIYYVSIFTGTFLSDIFFNKNKSIVNISHSQIKRRNAVFLFISVLMYILTIFGQYEMYLRFISIVFFIIFLINNDKIQNVLENKILVFLSNYSTDIYATHWLVMCSFTCYIYMILRNYNYALVSICNFFLSAIVIAIVAIVFNKICNLIYKIIKIISKQFLKEKTQ